MKYCEECGAKLQDNESFCSECGAKCSENLIVDEKEEVESNNIGKKRKRSLVIVIVVAVVAAISALGYFVVYPKVMDYLQDKEDQKAAQKVINLIDSLDEKKITADSEKDLDAIQIQYDALTSEQKELVKDYDKLEKAYKTLQMKKDEKTAQEVIDAIDKIEKDSLTADDTSVEELRNKYNELTEAQKEFVTNESKLKEFETIVAEKKEEKRKQEEEKKKQEEAEAKKNMPAPMDELLNLVGVEAHWNDFGSSSEYEKHMASVMAPWVNRLINEHSFYPGTTMIRISEQDRNSRTYFVSIYDDLNTGSYAGFQVNLNTDTVSFSQYDSNIVL